MAENVLEVRNLVKEFGPFRAVNGISFEVPKGKIIGFLGPNGAGKTTTINMLLGITTTTAGAINYFGKDFSTHTRECLSRINYTSSFSSLQGRITVMENLLVFSDLYDVKNPYHTIKELAVYFESEELLHKNYFDLSSGQRSRVNIIKSLLNDPELILMDEPTASLDPDVADKVLTLIEQLRKERSLSILYTSHDMEEVTRICDEVIFLSHGSIVAQDTPRNLMRLVTGAEVRVVFEGNKSKLDAYLTEKKFMHTFIDDSTVKIETDELLVPKVIFGIGKVGMRIIDIELNKPNLEDVFLQIAREHKHVVA